MSKKFVSWNVNGIRACMTKGFMDVFNELDADIFCLQETKMQEGQLELTLDGYHQFWHYAEKKGYSGTAVFSKEEPISVQYGIGIEELDTELAEKNLPVYLCGDGYTITKNGLKQTKICNVPYRMRLASAYSVALCALDSFNKGDVVDDASLVPIYLRPSQAERERNERLGLNK